MDQHKGSIRASPVEPATRLLVVGRIGAQRYAWLASCVERVLAMATVTRATDLPPHVVGLLDVHGDILAVVDPRSRLGLPPQAARPEQHLLLLTATERFLLWVDSIEAIVAVESSALAGLDDGRAAGGPFVTRVDGQLVSVLAAAVFDPGPMVQSAPGRR